MKKVIYLALIVLFLFASCNASPNEKGIGLMRLVFEPSEEIYSYSIVISDNSGKEVKNAQVFKSDLIAGETWSVELIPGTYTISVEAKDSDGKTLLYGEKSAKVFKEASSNVDMHLDAGIGQLELSIVAANENQQLSIIDDVKIERLSSNFTVYVDKDDIEDGVISLDSLPSGEYLATIKYSILMQEGFEKSGEHLELITIQNGELTSIESKISYGGSSQIVIGDMVGKPVSMFSLEFSHKSESNNDFVDFYIPEKTEVSVTVKDIDTTLYDLTWSISDNPKATLAVNEAEPNVAIIYAEDITAFKLELLVEGKSGKRYEKGFVSLNLESQAINLH